MSDAKCKHMCEVCGASLVTVDFRIALTKTSDRSKTISCKLSCFTASTLFWVSAVRVSTALRRSTDSVPALAIYLVYYKNVSVHRGVPLISIHYYEEVVSKKFDRCQFFSSERYFAAGRITVAYMQLFLQSVNMVARNLRLQIRKWVSNMNLYSGVVREYKWSVVIFAVTVVYLVAMDVTLYYHIQDRTPVKVSASYYAKGDGQFQHSSSSSASSSLHESTSDNSLRKLNGGGAVSDTVRPKSSHQTAEDMQQHNRIIISPFANPSIKFIMLDHFNLYIATPLAAMFAKIINFNEFLFFVTPNMISFAGVLMGFLSARLLASQTRSIIVMGIAAQLVRNFFDALDGIIAKSRPGGPSTLGYYVDGIADTIGIAAMLIGVLYHLQGSRKVIYSAAHSNSSWSYKFDPEKDAGVNGSGNGTATTSKRILSVVLCYGLMLGISGMFWNIYVIAYHDLLNDPPHTQQQADLQNAVIQSSIMWFMTLAWRLFNSFAFVEMLLIAIYLEKTWEFLVWIQYIGMAILFVLVFFTAIFYRDIKSFIVLTENSIVPGNY